MILSALVGSGGEPSYALRPLVSIDLKLSGYKLVPNDGTDGAEYKLIK